MRAIFILLTVITLSVTTASFTVTSVRGQLPGILDSGTTSSSTTTPQPAPQPAPQQAQATTPPAPTIPADYIEVSSVLFGATTSYPPDWELRPPYNSARGYSLLHVFATEGEEGEFTADMPNFNVEVAEDRGAMADYEAKAYLEQRAFELMTQHEQFEIQLSQPTVIAGQPAWMLKYTFTSLISGEEVTHIQAMGGVAGRTYLLTYSAPADLYDRYLPAVQNMVNSFRVQ